MDGARGPDRPDPGDGPGPAPWTRLGSRAGEDLGLFRVRRDRLLNPRTGREHGAVVLETPPWANVVAVDEEGRILLVRQYRFGVGRVTLEIPGGVAHHDEPPDEAARRELCEETGYTAQRWTYLGAVEPNPAFHTSLCHHFLAEGARRTHAPAPDPGEDIQVVTLTPDAVRQAVHRGEIRHSLALTALARVLRLWEPRVP